MLNNKRGFFTVSNNSGSSYIIREFKNLGMTVYAGDSNHDAIGRFFADKFIHLPPQNDKGYVNHLLRIVEEEKIDILIPAGEEECLMIAMEKEKFLNLNCIPVVVNTKTLEISIDKANLYDYLSNNSDIPMMNYHVVNNLEDYEEGLELLKNYNLCIKPATGSGTRGFAILNNKPLSANDFFTKKTDFYNLSINNLREMLNNSTNIPKLILMEVLEGVHYDSNMICKNGEILFQSVRTREETALGTITKATVVRNNEIEGINKKITRALNTTGYICTQFIGNKLIEVNPRWSTSLNYDNINEYLMSIKLLLGEDITIGEKEHNAYFGTKMLRYWDVIVYKDDTQKLVDK